MLKLDLEAVVEDAGDEVFQFEIQISLIYWKFVGLYKEIDHHIIILSESLLRRDYLSKSYCAQLCLGTLKQWLHTPVLERSLSTLGSQIVPLVWSLAIRQVVTQHLTRVIPDMTCTEVSPCYRGLKTTA